MRAVLVGIDVVLVSRVLYNSIKYTQTTLFYKCRRLIVYHTSATEILIRFDSPVHEIT